MGYESPSLRSIQVYSNIAAALEAAMVGLQPGDRLHPFDQFRSIPTRADDSSPWRLVGVSIPSINSGLFQLASRGV